MEKPRRRWRAGVAIGLIVLMNIFVFAGVAMLSTTPDIASAQDDGEDDEKLTPIDFYPARFAEGAVAYSITDPWPKTDLTFFFHEPCAPRLNVDCDAAQDAVRIAFGLWAEVSALTFTEVDTVADADMEVTFTDDDEEGVLGRPGDVLAYAYFPRYGGDMFIDAAEPWTIGDGQDTDLIMTAAHEIGHGIGLDHSEFKDALMYPYAQAISALSDDDIAAVQELYGPPETVESPTVTDTPSTNFVGNIDVVSVSEIEAKGTIDDTTPYNIWSLEVAAGTTVTATVYRASGDLDPYVGILSEDLSLVLVENDNWVDDNARVVYTFEQGGTYSLVATRFGFDDGASSGTYNLIVQTNAATDVETVVPPAPQTITWQVTNYSGFELCEIYFSPSEDTSWGSNQIGDFDPLQNNFFYYWFIEPDTYDILVYDCFGNHLEFYGVNATRDVEIEIYQNRINVLALENPPQDTTTTTTTDVDSSAETFIWRVSNYSTESLCAIYFNASTEDIWGVNRIEDDDPLEPGFYYQWELEGDVLDVRVDACSTGFLEFYGVDLASNIEVAVYNEEISLFPLD